jgi:hypothetical protein
MSVSARLTRLGVWDSHAAGANRLLVQRRLGIQFMPTLIPAGSQRSMFAVNLLMLNEPIRQRAACMRPDTTNSGCTLSNK